MEINRAVFRSEFTNSIGRKYDEEIFDKIAEFKTFENLFDITLGTFFREVVGEDNFYEGWEILEKFSLRYFPIFVDSKLFNSIIENLERLNDNETYGRVMTFSKSSLLAMKAQWDILNQEERMLFLRPAHGLTVGYILAGGQYFCDLFTCYGSKEDYKKEYPTLYKTSYIAYNCFSEYPDASMLSRGLQYENLQGYLKEMEIRKNNLSL